MTLDQLITEAARSGRLESLTLSVQHDGQWRAAFLLMRKGWIVEIDADPIAALTKVLASVAPSKPAGIFD